MSSRRCGAGSSPPATSRLPTGRGSARAGPRGHARRRGPSRRRLPADRRSVRHHHAAPPAGPRLHPQRRHHGAGAGA